MKVISACLALIALGMGLMAAWKWYFASQIQPKPNWKFEPVEPTLRRMGWDTATLEAFDSIGRLNATAALWTAASVVFSALSSIAGAFSN
jgi:hypothetical protein